MPAPPPPGEFPQLKRRYEIALEPEDVLDKEKRLALYQRLHVAAKATGVAKPDMVANKKIRQQGGYPDKYIGHPRGVRAGDVFEGRAELDTLAIHSLALQGIDYIKGCPCTAVCLSGGYADDDDSGLVFWYTGQGGNSKGTQTRAQTLTLGNLALHLAMVKQTPVRVCRGLKYDQGARMYAYEGLYLVQDMKFTASRDGPMVYKFKLAAVAGHSVASAQVNFRHFARSSALTRRTLAPRPQPASSDTVTASADVAVEPRHPRKCKDKAAPPAAPPAGLGDCKARGKGRAALTWRWDSTPDELASLEAKRADLRSALCEGKQVAVLCPDISHGTERLRVPVVNDTGLPAALPNVRYRPDYSFSPSAAIYVAELFRRGLVQWAGSKHTAPAPGAPPLPNFSSGHAVQFCDNGLLDRIQFTPLMEDGTDRRRLASITARGPYLPLEVFYTGPERGWGMRCLVHIPIGSFICRYIGRVCTGAEAEELGASDVPGAAEYLMDLDHCQAVVKHLQANPDDPVEPGELELLPDLPPPDFYQWAATTLHHGRQLDPPPPLEDIVSGAAAEACRASQGAATAPADPDPDAAASLSPGTPRACSPTDADMANEDSSADTGAAALADASLPLTGAASGGADHAEATASLSFAPDEVACAVAHADADQSARDSAACRGHASAAAAPVSSPTRRRGAFAEQVLSMVAANLGTGPAHDRERVCLGESIVIGFGGATALPPPASAHPPAPTPALASSAVDVSNAGDGAIGSADNVVAAPEAGATVQPGPGAAGSDTGGGSHDGAGASGHKHGRTGKLGIGFEGPSGRHTSTGPKHAAVQLSGGVQRMGSAQTGTTSAVDASPVAWECNGGGQMCLDGAALITACQKRHGRTARWSSYTPRPPPPDFDADSREHLVVDARHEGNVARFINHSCDGNLNMQTIFSVQAGSSVFHYIGLFVAKDGGIPAGEELTYDYKWAEGNFKRTASHLPCRCGAANCQGNLL